MLKNRGFTLIELMITVAVIAILSAIAVPSYTTYIQRGKITEAISSLSSLTVQMEQAFQDNRSYPTNCAGNLIVKYPPPEAKYFGYACVASGATYTITATGLGPMSAFSYRIDQQGNKTSTVPQDWNQANIARCWVLKKDGSC
jgi:type IV pilus assembly protein PilE